MIWGLNESADKTVCCWGLTSIFVFEITVYNKKWQKYQWYYFLTVQLVTDFMSRIYITSIYYDLKVYNADLSYNTLKQRPSQKRCLRAASHSAQSGNLKDDIFENNWPQLVSFVLNSDIQYLETYPRKITSRPIWRLKRWHLCRFIGRI